ncbi:MAG: hypothetical protein C0501_22440 [Isosphaera sp.]|nr:hypothetical protein [Isosphaera sp.]
MTTTRRTRFALEELQPRDAPAVLAYDAPVGNGADVITVRLNGNRFEILNDGAVVKRQNANNVDSIRITGAAGEGDSLVVDYSPGAFAQTVQFTGGATGAAGTVTRVGGTVALDFSASARAITATIRLNTTTVTFAGGGGVSVVGTVSSVTGTSGNDTFIDNTPIELLTLNGGLGNDMYRLAPGSDVTITDDGGDDTLDFGSSDQGITATVGTTATMVTDLDGRVFFSGTIEALLGTRFDDRFTDTAEVDLLFAGGDGNDTYDLQPGSRITIVEGNGNDSIRLTRGRFGVNANLANGVITDTNGNQVLIVGGQVENLDGTVFADTIVGSAADNVLFGGGGNDVLNGGAGNDTYVLVAGGTDVITDTGGVDTLDFSRTTASGVNVDLSRTNGSAQNIAPGASLALNGVIERVIGTNQDDVLTGGAGDDTLIGLGGDDRLMGQSGNDLLFGGAGDDDLNGGPGRDILVGGPGADRLKGDAGEDILIAGFTAYDAGPVDLVAWTAIQEVWVGPDTTAARVAAIRAGVGPLGMFRLRAGAPGQTVFDDGNPDTLTGGQSADWFFARVPGNDTITDKDDTEFLNDLG